VDVTSISAALTSIKTAADIARLIKDSGSSLERAESKLKLAELMSALADAKLEVVEIQQLVSDKDSRIRSLEEELAVKEKLEWDAPYYWLVNDSAKDGPFCQLCFDTDRKLVRLQIHGVGLWRCGGCKGAYTDKDYKKPEARSSYAVSGRKPFIPFRW